MNYNSIYKEIKREYDYSRTNSENKYRQKKEELYKKVPRLKEIDTELANESLKIAKKLINSSILNKEILIEDYKRYNLILREEKNKLIEKNNIIKNVDFYNCSLCKDTGYVSGNKKCICFEQKLIEKYYDIANMKSILNEENFDTFDFSYYSDEPYENLASPLKNMELIYGNCKHYIEGFDEVPINLFLYGNTGLGKTFLCNCIAKEILDKGVSVLYVTSPKLFDKLEKYRFGKDTSDSIKEEISMISEARMLIIDDLGSEFHTKVTQTELFTIINNRIIDNKSTIISTNLDIESLQKNYTDRIVSRLFGHYKMLHFFGKDIRFNKKIKPYDLRENLSNF